MKKETFNLREKPKLEFVLNENNFELINSQDYNQNEIYQYGRTDSVEIEKKRINWAITILSYIVDFIFSPGAGADTYRTKTKLKFNYKNTAMEIILADCDLEKAELFTQKLKEKLN